MAFLAQRLCRNALLQHRVLPAASRRITRAAILLKDGPSQPQGSTNQHGFVAQLALKLAPFLGLNSPRQVTQRKVFALYHQNIKGLYAKDQTFWEQSCGLPPTFQSWFLVTNLYIWLLTVRLRALPPPWGQHHIQALVDHFFVDVEDQIRVRLPKRISERVVTKELKICRDQWQGITLSLDYGFVKSDAELATAIWRNFLGARGAEGIDGRGQAINPDVSLDAAESPRNPEADDKSGVRDFEGPDRDRYLEYPILMLSLSSYIRQELARLAEISDEDMLAGEFGKFNSLLHSSSGQKQFHQPRTTVEEVPTGPSP